MFLLRNGYEIDAAVDEQEAMVLGVAAGHISREVFTNWVKSRIVRRGWRRPTQPGAGTSGGG
jgi:death-on-curing protein